MSNLGFIVFVGTKAQFIKTAPILREMDRRGVVYQLIYTGQHSETFDQLETVFATRTADDNLVPGTEADSARSLAGWLFAFCRAAITRIRCGAWRGASFGLVHGDTASTLMAALALRTAGVPVVHVEAGLRSPRLLSPFPEELVRRAVSRLAVVHFAPDAEAARNLRGVPGLVMETGGNTMRDALLMALAQQRPLPPTGGTGGYAVVSIHRSENLRRRATLDALMVQVIATAAELPTRFVLHPVTRKRLQRTGWIDRLRGVPGLTLMERVDYVSFVALMVGARFLMTDGGSNQEEAAMLGLPTLLMRTETERGDGLDSGSVELSGLDDSHIHTFVRSHADKSWQLRIIEDQSPSARIVDTLLAAADAR